jgi:hypothetical protein
MEVPEFMEKALTRSGTIEVAVHFKSNVDVWVQATALSADGAAVDSTFTAFMGQGALASCDARCKLLRLSSKAGTAFVGINVPAEISFGTTLMAVIKLYPTPSTKLYAPLVVQNNTFVVREATTPTTTMTSTPTTTPTATAASTATTTADYGHNHACEYRNNNSCNRGDDNHYYDWDEHCHNDPQMQQRLVCLVGRHGRVLVRGLLKEEVVHGVWHIRAQVGESDGTP